MTPGAVRGLCCVIFWKGGAGWRGAGSLEAEGWQVTKPEGFILSFSSLPKQPWLAALRGASGSPRCPGRGLLWGGVGARGSDGDGGVVGERDVFTTRFSAGRAGAGAAAGRKALSSIFLFLPCSSRGGQPVSSQRCAARGGSLRWEGRQRGWTGRTEKGEDEEGGAGEGHGAPSSLGLVFLQRCSAFDGCCCAVKRAVITQRESRASSALIHSRYSIFSAPRVPPQTPSPLG